MTLPQQKSRSPSGSVSCLRVAPHLPRVHPLLMLPLQTRLLRKLRQLRLPPLKKHRLPLLRKPPQLTLLLRKLQTARASSFIDRVRDVKARTLSLVPEKDPENFYSILDEKPTSEEFKWQTTLPLTSRLSASGPAPE